MGKKILLTAGGTAGHLFPALSLAKDLKGKNIQVLFAGSGLSKNPHFKNSIFHHKEVRSTTFNLKEGIHLLPKFIHLALGLKDSLKLLKQYKPDLVVGFGSYHTLPVLIAALIRRVPFVLNEQNVQPGRVNRLLINRAQCVYTHYPSFQTSLKKAKRVSFPLRFKNSYLGKQAAIREKLGLNPSKKTLLIFGGSQGAERINQQVLMSLSFFKNIEVQIIHLIGKHEVLFCYEKEYSEKFKESYVLKVFEEKMDELYVASDFVISRAGASTIHELIEFEKPALLIPYPYANNHQLANADFFTKQVQGGIKLLEKNLTDSRFCDYIQKNLTEDQLLKYNQAIKQWKKDQVFPTLAEQIMQEIPL